MAHRPRFTHHRHDADHTGADHSGDGSTTRLVAEARVDTERPSRYLTQLCRHIAELEQAHGVLGARAEWSDTDGRLTFPWGRCTIHAEAGALTLRAEAGDESALARLTEAVGGRLEQIGRRDGLAVTWSAGAGEEAGS